MDALKLSAMAPEERTKSVIDSMVQRYGDRAARPESYSELDWCLEPWTRGCYGGNCPPGMLTRFGPAIKRPIGPIHWAGTETAVRWNGYIDGAIESGKRAAAEITDR